MIVNVKEFKKELLGFYQCNATNILGNTTVTGEIGLAYAPTVFVRDVTMKQYVSTYIECEVDAAPEVHFVSWKKDGKRIVPTQKIIHIRTFMLSRTGTYECTAANSEGNSSATGKLDYELSARISLVKELNVVAGTDVSHNCSAVSQPPIIEMAWYRNENVMILETKHNKNYIVLSLKRIQKSQEGQYECRAKGGDEVQVSESLTVKVASKNFKAVPQSSTVMKGKQITLQCQFASVIAAKISWNFNNTQLYNSSTKTGLLGNVNIDTDDYFRNRIYDLTIINAQLINMGAYTCIYNDERLTAMLTVIAPPSKTTLNAMTTKKRFRENIRILLNCSSVGVYPPPEYAWRKDDAEIYDSDNERIQYDQRNLKAGELTFTTLHILLHWHDDRSVIKCGILDKSEKDGVTTYDFTAVSNYTLYISYAPKMEPYREVEIYKGENLTLLCEYDAKPKGKVEWVKNSHTLQSEQNKRQMLFIENVTIEDSGLYTCSVKNIIAGLSYENATEFSVTVLNEKEKTIEEKQAPVDTLIIYGVVGGIMVLLITFYVGVVMARKKRKKRKGSGVDYYYTDFSEFSIYEPNIASTVTESSTSCTSESISQGQWSGSANLGSSRERRKHRRKKHRSKSQNDDDD